MKGFPTRSQVELTRQRYPPGTQVELTRMADDPQAIPPGTRGKVLAVDDAGQLLMKWDNGCSLSLIPGVDQFRKVASQEVSQEQSMTMGGMQL